MKESVLDILIYLFENYSDPDFDPETDGETFVAETQVTASQVAASQVAANPVAEKIRDSLRSELVRAGFRATVIDSALAWLDALDANTARGIAPPAGRAMRVFAERECAKLDTECRSYILYLENIGILNAMQREVVIDRLLALDSQSVDIDQTKWVVLMVLFSQPGQEDAYARMEDLLFSGHPEALH